MIPNLFWDLSSRRRVPPKWAVRGAGQNSYGELGMGGNGNQYQYGGDSYMTSFSPPRSGTDPDLWASLSLTFHHAAGVKSGLLYTAGDNSYGQLGLGDTTARRAFTQVGAKTDWRKVGVGSEFTAALDAQGKIWTMGRNDIAAQLNDGTATGQRNVPYDTSTTDPAFHPAGVVFQDIEVGHRFVMGLDQNRDIWTWGNNGSRQLGHGAGTGDKTQSAGTTQDTVMDKVDPVGPWRKMTAGAYHGGAIHATTGEVWMWGLASDGQRGGTQPSTPGPTWPSIVPCNVTGRKWVDVSCGEYHTFFIRDDGTMWACGRNNYGQLGIGTTDNTPTLTQVPGNWRYVKGGYYHTFAIDTKGTLWGWGRNDQKQLGSASLSGSQYTSPQQVDAATNWITAAPGEYSSLAATINF